jgi:hypothetical protein
MLTRTVHMDLPGGHQKSARAEFHFSNHCYSRSPDELPDGTFEAIPLGRFVADGSVHTPRPRIFCPIRYELSKHLVSCIDAIIADDALVTRTKHVNYFNLTELVHGVPGIASPASYYVFFSIKTVKPDNDAKFIKISVESAYIDANANGTKSSEFSRALGEEWAGLPHPSKKKKKKS